MYNQPFYIPGYNYGVIPNIACGTMIPNSLMNTRALGTAAANTTRATGLFGRLGNAFGALRAFNWGGLINNTSKTLGIINQTIPLVRQVGPMVGNMRSMLKIASVFKDETDFKTTKKNNIYTQKSNSNINTNNISSNQNINTQKKDEESLNYNTNDDSPTFFIN